MRTITASDVATAFVDAINAHDLDKLVDLMTYDHEFIDSMGASTYGLDALRAGWMGYFAIVPDYKLTIADALNKDAVVALFGTVEGTYSKDGRLDRENFWTAPAAWVAVTRDGKVARWQVYCDNEPIRALMRR
jgi:ketosteroid isomerase-like protein